MSLRLPRDMLAALDDYRRGEADVPTRPEAIRRLLAEALPNFPSRIEKE